MPKLAANLSMLFDEVPFLERFALARAAGFDAVEVQFPYAWPAAEIRRRLDDNGLQLVLHNLPGGDWEAGERGIACLPGREQEFRRSVDQAIGYALALGAPQLNCLAGKAPADVPDALLRATLVANLRYAAAAFGRAGLKLLVEPINVHDIPGFYLNRSGQTLALLDEVGADNAYLQYDIYHMQRMEGELALTLERERVRIAHIQLADSPGRHEPGTGEINFAFLLGWLDRIGYSGWVGCEYKPATTTQAGLDWRRRLGL
ncbi:MAG: hydroxypyruvate isomerase [Pseudomonadota bacterium]|nr:hydroxypyruvate isomerase [Rubrivivax sp.]NLZ40948.1 hydroxypyruvate isomerase [Comamonadaceae bacterium]